MMVIAFVFFPIPVPGNWPHNLSRSEMRTALESVNLIPLHNTGILSPAPLSRNSVRDIIANLILTVPLGMAVPYLSNMRMRHVLLLAVTVGLMFEGIELGVKLITGTFYHTVDINDVIMNTLGVLAGYIFFSVVRWIIHKIRG